METTSPILTPEERAVLVLGSVHPNGKHLSNSEIGQRLGISVTRVKALTHQACVKLEAHNKNEAIYIAMERGEINLNELLSLEELAEILSSVDPDCLRLIAKLVRQNLVEQTLAEKKEHILRAGRTQAGILTNRERDVLILASHGLTNREMADRLCITTSAVRTFLNRAFTKLGARKKADAVQAALKRREIAVDEMSSLDELVHFLAPLGAESIEKIAELQDEKRRKESTSSSR